MITVKTIGALGALETKAEMLEHIRKLAVIGAEKIPGAVGPTYAVEPEYYDRIVISWLEYAAGPGAEHGYQVTRPEVLAALTKAGWYRAAPGIALEIGWKPPDVIYEEEPARQAIAEDAITYVLTFIRMAPFPDGEIQISAFDFDKLVARAWQKAKDLSSGYGYVIPHTELAQALADRGYRAISTARAATAPPALPERYPLPGKVELPLVIPAISTPFPSETPPLVLGEKRDSSWLIWVGLAALGFLALTGERSPHRSRSRRAARAGPIKSIGYYATPRERKRGQKLLYLWHGYGTRGKPTVVAKKKLEYVKKQSGKEGELYPTYAYSADHAREIIRKRPYSPYREGKEWRLELQDPPRPVKPSVSSPAEQLKLFGGLSGPTANCVIWQEVESKKRGGLLWRCLAYGPPCEGSKCTSPVRLPPGQKKQIRVCVDTKKVKTTSPRFGGKSVDRCAKYERVCPDGACIPEAMPKPQASPGHGANVKSMVRSLAKNMADERNAAEEEAGKTLARDILSRGGIRMHKKTTTSIRQKKPGAEEFAVIPLVLRRKAGMPPDEMAAEMGMDETELMQAIQREYPGTKKKKRKFTWKDFEAQAEDQVWSAVDAGMVSGLGVGAMTWRERHDPQRGTWRHFWQVPGKAPKQVPSEEAYNLTMRHPSEGTMYLLRAWSADEGRRQIAEGLIDPYHTPQAPDRPWGPAGGPRRRKGAPVVTTPEQMTLLGGEALLFPDLRREMVLETEDISISDDPLEIHLERKGWKMNRVRQLQESMSEKAVPDLFTGKTKPLTAGEKELQRDIDEFTAKMRSYRETVQAKHARA